MGVTESRGGAKQDALELEIFREALRAVIDELEVNIARTAYSFLIHEYKDFCVGFLTRNCELASQSQGNIPIFITDLGPAVKDIVDLIGEENLEAGDVFITNYNPVSGQHINNVVAATPIHTDGKLIGYLAIKSHWNDLGGISMGGSTTLDGRHILQEGAQLRGLRVMRAGRIQPEVLATIQANTYQTNMVTGDLMAQLSACTVGAQRWEERVAARWTTDEVEALFAAQFAASRRFAESMIEDLPDGEYVAECRMDDDGAGGDPMPLSLKVTIDGNRMIVDLSAMPPQVAIPINAGRQGGAISATRLAFKAIIAPDWPADDAVFEPLEVIVPDGTIISAVDGAPMAYWNHLMPTVVDLVIRAIGEILPERSPAGHFASMAVLNLSSVRPDGTRWHVSQAGAGGYGGNSEADGFGPITNYMLGDNMIHPCELMEAKYPLRVESMRVVHGSGGAGKFRGGPGLERTVEVLEPTRADVVFDRTVDPAWGLAGGEPGKAGGVSLRRPGETEWEDLKPKDVIQAEAGAAFRYRTGGGGGWGSPEA